MQTSRTLRPAAPFVAAVLLAAVPLSGNAAQWSITDLGAGFTPADINDHGTVLQRNQVIGGQSFYFTAINNPGQAVGTGPDGRPYLYDKGSLSRLDGLGYASDINDKGQVIGMASLREWHAAIWEKGAISFPVGSRRYSEGISINESGEILAWTTDERGQGQYRMSFTYDGAALTPIGLDGPSSMGMRINDHGAVAGQASTKMDFAQHAFLYDKGVGHDLGTLGGWSSFALDVNNRNDVVGRADTDLSSSDTHAFLYRDGRMIDLAVLPEVVAAGWSTLITASAVNERGQIVGVGFRDGVYSGFLLQATPVPEPGTWALAVAGLLTLRLRRSMHRPGVQLQQ